MRNKYIWIIVGLFIVSFSFPVLGAQDREAAQELLLTQAEAESSSVVSGEPKAGAEITGLSKSMAPGSKEEQILDAEGEYRQKLREIVTAEKEEKAHEIDSFIRYIPKSSLRGQEGKISIIHNESQYSYSFKAFDVLPLQVGFMEEYIGIGKDPSTPLSLPGKLTALRLNAQATLPFFFDKTYLRFRIMPGWSSDDWSIKASNTNIPVQTFLIFQPNDMLTFILGAAYSGGGAGNTILPVGGLIYKPNDKLSFNIIPPSPSITYSINDKLSVFIEGDFVSSDFKVTKDGQKGVTLNYDENHIGAGLAYDITKNITAGISSGYMVSRSLSYNDSLGKASLKSNIYTEFRIEIGI